VQTQDKGMCQQSDGVHQLMHRQARIAMHVEGGEHTVRHGGEQPIQAELLHLQQATGR
jgi:hypothetical protein